MKEADMSEIKKCENCGNENIEIINRFKGHYSCGKCGRDTEKLYEIEHDAEIRAKAIEEFASKMKWEYENSTGVPKKEIEFAKAVIDMVAERMKGGAE